EKAHERQPIADQIFGALVRQVVASLQHQHLEHQNMVKCWPTAFCSVRTPHRLLQIGTEQLEIDYRVQPLQAVALGRELLQPPVHSEKPRLTSHLRPPAQTRPIES